MENKENSFTSATKVLAYNLKSMIANIPQKLTNNATQISLRANRPLCIECPDKRYYITTNNCVTDTLLKNNMVTVTPQQMFETFQNICNYSVYSRQNEINQGFVTIKGGHRAGICGTAVIDNNGISNIKNITSINIRIAREVIGCSQELRKLVEPTKGVLICGAPCSGKTTLIRDLSRSLSFTKRVCVIDERNELSANVSSEFYNDIGMCDVFVNYIKKDAIIHAVRNMSPDIIVCDEISTDSDFSALKFSLNCGVNFIATIHAACKEDLLSRDGAVKLLRTNAFEYIVFLDSDENIGKIKQVHKISDLTGELYA